MMRKQLFKIYFALALPCLSFLTYSSEMPNIVVFIADDHSVADSSVYGNADIRTPMMDSLAKEGLTFNKAFVASPACGPSRSALLSGLMPARNGAEENHQTPHKSSQIMVKKMQAAGYEVAAFGKVAHLDYGKFVGFDIEKQGRREQISEKVKIYLENRTSKKPLLLLVGDHRPHVPWFKHMDYDPKMLTLPKWLIDTPQTREHWARYLTEVTGMDKQMANVDKLAQGYFGSDEFLFIYTADHGAQWPFAKWNLYDKGINVPFIARWPQHIEAGKRTEAMVSWIDIFPTLLELAGSKVPEDIDGKSFLGILTGEKNVHRNAIYTTTTADGVRNIYPSRSVRTAKYKYIKNIYPNAYHSTHSDILRLDGAGQYWHSWDEASQHDTNAKSIIDKYYQRPAIEFFDLEKDPEELVNLADNADYKEKIRSMSQMLDKWMKEQGDTVRMLRKTMPLNGLTPHELNESSK